MERRRLADRAQAGIAAGGAEAEPEPEPEPPGPPEQARGGIEP